MPSDRRSSFWKLDLEGGEYDALRGGRAALDRHRPAIVFENGREATAKNYDYTIDDFFALFRGRGYALYDLFGNEFDETRWSVPAVPWYTIAVPHGSETEATLPNLMRSFADEAARSVG
jgi:hypothetical protein